MDQPKSKKLILNENAKTANPDKPAFLAVPENSPVYHGFPLRKDTEIDGWILGEITELENEEGCDWGDAYVQAPDGTRAGLVWSVGDYPTVMVCEPTKDRWGVYEMAVPVIEKNIEDVLTNFRHVLPELKYFYAKSKNK